MLTQEKTIGDFVAENFRTAEVFKKYHIDFCCKGGRTVEEACDKKKVSPEEIYKELEEVANRKSEDIDFNSWPLDLLADYVEKTHHRYVEEKSAMLIPYLNKLCKVHGERHPELFEINQSIADAEKELFSMFQELVGTTDEAQADLDGLLKYFQKVGDNDA